MSRKLVVVIPQLTPAQREDIARAAQSHGFQAQFFDSDAQALPALADAEVIFSPSAALPPKAPGLKWVCTSSAGANQFFAPGTFAAPDVLLSNSSGAYGVTISEHIIMMALEVLRRQMDYNQMVSRRQWIRNLPVRSIHGSRIALLGTGDIGRQTAIRLRAFSPACIVGVNRSGKNPQGLFDRVVPQTRLDALLPGIDLMILSLPGTADTHHMMDERRLAMLPDGALLVNVGRGNAIDQKALERELRSGRLYAALDVFDQEPLPQDDPLWDCPNLLITPHVAGNMTLAYTQERIVALFLEDFENYCAGRPLKRRVDLAQGY